MDPTNGSANLRQRKMVPRIAVPDPETQPTPICHPAVPGLTMGGRQSHRDHSPMVEEGGHSNQHSNHLPPRHNGDAAAATRLIHVAEDMGDGFVETSFTQPLLESDTASHDDAEDGESSDRQGNYVLAQTQITEEVWWQISLQVFFPYIVAGFGMVGAGMVLDIVQHWVVFETMTEVFILVPALLGLKGNLEMTLASRLSTQANLGNMDKRQEMWSMITGNIVLTQVQAIVVGFLASVAAMVLGWIPEGKFNIKHAMVLCASSVTTAALASFVLGSIMVAVVVLSRKCHINPDNVATPIAASLGDLITLSLLASLSTLFYRAALQESWLCPLIITCFLSLTPLWWVISHRNKYVNEVLYSGWTPVIGAMVISSLGGLILDFTVSSYKGIAVFQPVINGVGGNLVAVHASRLSTSLHLCAKPGTMPPNALRGCANPFTSFCGSGPAPRTTRVLMGMVVPGHLIFMYTISYMQAGHTSITALFAVTYLSAAVIQVSLLLYIANWMVHFLWKGGNDPDNFSIPYLTALGDLLGTGLLAIAFHILYVVGDRDDDLGD